MTLLGLEIARAKNIPFIGTYHTLLNRYTHYFFNGKIVTPKMVEFASKFIGNLCDYLIAPTERVKDELILYGVKRPIHVLPSGIDLENYKKRKKGFIRQKLKIVSRKKILLYVGRLGKEKSVDFLLEAFSIISKENSNCVLVLVGDGPEKQNLKKFAKKLNIQNNVYFFGSVKHSDVANIYADSDIFVFASRTETQGLVILEALASGLPVVAVNDPAFDSIILNEENGYTVSDKTEFAKKVLHLLANNKIQRDFSHNARKSIEKFSVQNTARYLEQLYKQAIEKKQEKDQNTIQTKSVNGFKKFLVKANDTLRKYYE